MMSKQPVTKAGLRSNFLRALDQAVAEGSASRVVISLMVLALIEQKGWPGPVDFGELLDKLHERFGGKMDVACMWSGSSSGSSIMVEPASRDSVVELPRSRSGSRTAH